MKAVIYARFSSDKQNEASIEGQLRECMQYAEYNGVQVIGNYIDRAFSAKTDHRPEFQHMIKDSYKNLFDIVLVWKLDRFSRDRYDSAHYKRILKKNGVRVISATEAISESPEGILLESLLEGFEHTNGHKEYKKLNSELKAAISMYRKNKNDSSSIIKKLKLIISFVFLNDGKRLTVNHSVSLLLSLL